MQLYNRDASLKMVEYDQYFFPLIMMASEVIEHSIETVGDVFTEIADPSLLDQVEIDELIPGISHDSLKALQKIQLEKYLDS